MSQQTLSTGPAPRIVIDEVGGDLQVKGWERPEVLLKASRDESSPLALQGEEVHVHCSGDCILRVPELAVVTAKQISGDARFKMLEDGLHIEQVGGSLAVRDTGEVTVGRVHGELLARQVDGDLAVDSVSGNVVLRDIQGSCTIGKVGSNLDVRDAEGSLSVQAAGNVRLRFSLLVGEAYHARAGGNLHCRMPEDASLRVRLSAGNILVLQPDGGKTRYERDHEFTLGDGQIPVDLQAGGTLLFDASESAWAEGDEFQSEMDSAFAGFAAEFGQQISDEIAAQIDSQMHILDEQLKDLPGKLGKVGLPSAEVERVMEQARQARARAAARAEEKMHRAQEKLDRKLSAGANRAEQRARAAEKRAQEQRRRSWSFEWSSPPSAASRQKAAASDEERLMILRMLEQKKISLEEAEKLLAALESE